MGNRLQYNFLIFCFVWFFLIDYVLNDIGLSSVAVYINYILYIIFAFRLLYFLFFKPSSFASHRGNLFFRRSTTWLLLYMAYAVSQIILNPNTSSFTYFRQNYSVVIPSFSLAIFTGRVVLKSRKGVNELFRSLYWVMAVVIVYSEINSIGSFSSKYGVVDLRAGGIFDQANNYGYFLTLFAILSFFDLTNLIQINRFKWVTIFSLVFCFIVILRTGSYGSLIITMAIGLFLNYRFLTGLSLPKFIGTITLLLIVGGTIVRFSQSIGSARVEALRSLFSGQSDDELRNQSTFDVRSTLIIKGLQSSAESPLFGNGYKARDISIEGTLVPVHNVFIVEFLKGGFLGLAAILFLYTTFWKSVRKIVRQSRLRIASVLLFYLFFIDNTLTYSSFLSMNSGVIALGLITALLLEDAYERSRGNRLYSVKSQKVPGANRNTENV